MIDFSARLHRMPPSMTTGFADTSRCSRYPDSASEVTAPSSALSSPEPAHWAAYSGVLFAGKKGGRHLGSPELIDLCGAPTVPVRPDQDLGSTIQQNLPASLIRKINQYGCIQQEIRK
jgi:hypothetical protein